MFFYLIFGITYGFSSAIMPGPFITYLFSISLSQGFKRTFPAAFAPLLTDGPIALLVLLILTQLPAWIIQVLRFSGGIFILYLAYNAWKTWQTYNPKLTFENKSGQNNLFKAALVNLLNPGPYLGWSLVLGPLFLNGWNEQPLNGLILLISFYGTMILTFIGTILLFSAARNIGSKITRMLILISAIALAFFGCYQIYAGIVSF
jgi:threonine/homoserine/homoserine lactone efflux protein